MLAPTHSSSSATTDGSHATFPAEMYSTICSSALRLASFSRTWRRTSEKS